MTVLFGGVQTPVPVSTFKLVMIGKGTLWLVKLEKPVIDDNSIATPPSGPFRSWYAKSLPYTSTRVGG